MRILFTFMRQFCYNVQDIMSASVFISEDIIFQWKPSISRKCNCFVEDPD